MRKTCPTPPLAIKLPGYASMLCEETERLHKNYLRAMNRIAKMFCGKRVSEVIAEEASRR